MARLCPLRSFACCAVVLAVGAALLPAQQPEVLTNQSIVDLVHNGIGTDLIVKMIGEEPNQFNLSSSAVIRLKQQGVSQAIISAMISHKTKAADVSASPANAAVSAPPAAPSHDKRPNYTWETQDREDKMTGKTESLLILDTPAVTDAGERLGEFEAVATCGSVELDLKLTFISDAKPGFGFKQNTTTYYVSGGLAGALQAAHNHKKPWTETRVKIDDADPVVVTSEEDYLNSSLIYFTKPLDRNDQSGASGLIAFGTMLAANKPAGDVGAFLNARRVLLESTFEHGERAIMEIHPQDASLQAFNHRCAEATRPAPAPERASTAERSPASLGSGREVASRPVSPRYMVVAGSTFKVSLLEPVSLNDARSGRLVRARLTSALVPPGSVADPNSRPISVPANTEVLLRPRLTSYNGRQASVQLIGQSFNWKNTSVPFQASSPVTTVSQGSTAAVLNALRPALRVQVPPSRPDGNNILLKASDAEYTMTVNSSTVAPPSYQP